jgi:protein-tyrosine-phosphatase
MKTVLFACVHNAGRSQMAAALFNALSGPSKARAVSAGGAARSVAGQRDFISDAAAVAGKRVVLRAEVVASDQQHGAGERIVTVKP